MLAPSAVSVHGSSHRAGSPSRTCGRRTAVPPNWVRDTTVAGRSPPRQRRSTAAVGSRSSIRRPASSRSWRMRTEPSMASDRSGHRTACRSPTSGARWSRAVASGTRWSSSRWMIDPRRQGSLARSCFRRRSRSRTDRVLDLRPWRVTWSPDGTCLLVVAWTYPNASAEQTLVVAVPTDQGSPAVLVADVDGIAPYSDGTMRVPIQVWGRSPSD